MAALPPHIKALLDPRAYPYPVDRVDLIQTHISYVFLTEENVFKIKKPVAFSFLDFSTLEKRRRFCEEEVRLNQRGCPGVYRRVVPVTRQEDGRYRLGGFGEVVDYAVEMRRLPTERRLDTLLAQGKVTYEMVGALVVRLVEFHQTAETDEMITQLGGFDTFVSNWTENLRDLESVVGRTLSKQRWQRLTRFGQRMLSQDEELLRNRDQQGRVRDCHGDLRSDSVVFDAHVPGGICLFDSIEFNERLRYSDTALDIAFLAMDLDYRGDSILGDLLVGLYAAKADDEALPAILNLYKCYRACVRGKVERLLASASEIEPRHRAEARARARAYFHLAEDYTRRKALVGLVMVMGLSGSGKSVLAGRLAARLSAVLLSTDSVRHQQGMDTSERQAVDAGRYAPPAREQVYEALCERAGDYLRQGRGVILDGTFLERRQRDAVAALARTHKVPVLVVECSAPEGVIEERQRRRANEPWTTSEGRWGVYLSQKERFEAPDEVPAGNHLRIDNTLPAEDQLASVLYTADRLGLQGHPPRDVRRRL